jgi:ribosomal-protein-alanine N-acetyltransferase
MTEHPAHWSRDSEPIFAFSPMSQRDAIAIAAWHYEEPYSFYDADGDADDLAELLNPVKRKGAYYSVRDERRELVGFFEYKREETSVTIGLGLRPDLTGRGMGLRFVRAGIAFARNQFTPSTLRLTVATFNRRAIRVYERADFRPVREFAHWTNGGEYPFLEMICQMPST